MVSAAEIFGRGIEFFFKKLWLFYLIRRSSPLCQNDPCKHGNLSHAGHVTEFAHQCEVQPPTIAMYPDPCMLAGESSTPCYFLIRFSQLGNAQTRTLSQ